MSWPWRQQQQQQGYAVNAVNAAHTTPQEPAAYQFVMRDVDDGATAVSSFDYGTDVSDMPPLMDIDMEGGNRDHQNVPLENILNMLNTLPMSFEGGTGSDMSISLMEVHCERLAVNYRFHKFLHGDREDLVGPNPLLNLTEFPPEFRLPADRALLENIKATVIAKVDARFQAVYDKSDDFIKPLFIALHGPTVMYPHNLRSFATKMMAYSADLHTHMRPQPTNQSSADTAKPVPNANPAPSSSASAADIPHQRRTHQYTKIELRPGQPSPETVSSLVWNLLLGVQNEVRLLELTDEEGLRGPVSHFDASLLKQTFITAVMEFVDMWPHLRFLYGKYNLLSQFGLAVPSGWLFKFFYKRRTGYLHDLFDAQVLTQLVDARTRSAVRLIEFVKLNSDENKNLTKIMRGLTNLLFLPVYQEFDGDLLSKIAYYPPHHYIRLDDRVLAGPRERSRASTITADNGGK